MPADMRRDVRRTDVLRLFLRCGLVAYGGPIAHIAMFRQELVERRRWFDDTTFLRIVGTVHFLPGPNSTQAALVIGYRMAGVRGLLAAAAGFILPGVVAVIGLTAAYTVTRSGGALETAPSWFEPAALGVIAAAVLGMAPRVLGALPANVAFVMALAAGLLGLHPIGVLVVGTAAGVVAMWLRARIERGGALSIVILPTVMAAAASPDLREIARFFLRLGAIVFGGGYVILAYLSVDLVEVAGWIDERQLLHAVAISQIAPGPLFTVATAIGYMVGGMAGAAVATVAVFAPSLLATWVVGKRLDAPVRERGRLRAMGLSLFPAALGLMAAVMGRLAAALEPRSLGLTVALVTLVLAARIRLPVPVLLAAGAGAVALLTRIV